MPIKRINTTVYLVKDWDRSIAFYRDALGLKPLVIVPGVWAQLEAPGGDRIALQLQPPNGNNPPRVSIDVAIFVPLLESLRLKERKSLSPSQSRTLETQR